jgi:hypothetical protein
MRRISQMQAQEQVIPAPPIVSSAPREGRSHRPGLPE